MLTGLLVNAGVAVTSALLVFLASRLSARATRHSADLDHSIELINKWKEVAEDSEERAGKLEGRLNGLEDSLSCERQEARKSRIELSDRLAVVENHLTDALGHIVELWGWIDAGSPPPPPPKPEHLRHLLEKEYGRWGLGGRKDG